MTAPISGGSVKVSDVLSELSLGKSVAESDNRLDSYFVNTHTFNVLSKDDRDIVAGDKGTGKTALYRILMKRYRSIERLRTTEIISAFNIAGSPVFQQLLSIPEQTEGLYIAFWKTYFLTLVSNWLLDSPTLIKQTAMGRLEFFLARYSLRTADVSPGNIFTRLLKRFPQSMIPKSVEADFSIAEGGSPHFKPKVEFQPPPTAQPPNFFGVDYIIGFKLLEASLVESNLNIWIALDRLDEAFLGHPGVEVPALRALLRTYLDLQAVSNFKLKLFLRKDLFRKVTTGGFVNLTHINDQRIDIIWDDEDLLNLLIARVKDNAAVVVHLGLENLSNEEAFYRLFPQKIAQGEKQSNTWKWVLARLRDGNGVVAPRNLIDFVENCREVQLRSEVRNPREYDPNVALIDADAVRKAHKILSETRVQDTLIAEFADLAPYVEKFRKKKAEHNVDSLCDLHNVSPDEAQRIAKSLMEIGFLEEVGNSYKIPMLYRDGLAITQGKAFADAASISADFFDDVDFDDE
jgi:hypothetical protein